MKDWQQLKKELLQDKKFKAEYDKLTPKYRLISRLIKAREEQGITQSELAKKIGSSQSSIARIEAGNANPTVEFLVKIASALNKELNIEFC